MFPHCCKTATSWKEEKLRANNSETKTNIGAIENKGFPKGLDPVILNKDLALSSIHFLNRVHGDTCSRAAASTHQACSVDIVEELVEQ